MPLEITTRTIAMSETKSNTSKNIPGLSVKLPYVPIYQGGYGRMDRSTPAQGLATSRVASCIAVVLHSPTTGRTVLTHSPNFMRIAVSFTPIVDWVIGGDGKTDWSDFEAMAWLSGTGAKTTGVSMEVVILRGSDYASKRAAAYHHDGWVADFRQFLSTAAASRSFRVASCLDAEKFLKCGAVLVDKVTARITYLALERGREHLLDVKNPELTNQYTMAQQQQDLFVAHVLQERQPIDASADLHLQYDVSLYGRAMPLPDEARLLLRLKPATAANQSLLLRTLGVSSDWISGPGLSMGLTKSMLNGTMQQGRSCELCGDTGDSVCSLCKGAWYCGKQHQTDDWKAHKTWCKAHRVTTK
ncbi:hypothetical protein B0H16DRAFT_1896443 [Mycena metata]|uniref:MYND-type domain-containing protein n=1 Tax=Mycena metata TaxID=1033252 RepID=A0AAD7MK96_9AGAR|nr:hypothetical protein B0H16DRAFT_1896443 [Mycena metata]